MAFRISSTVALLLGLFPTGLTAQGLFLYSGNGQIVMEYFRAAAPMVVEARDGAGRPMAGVQIGWAITQGDGTLTGQQTATDANGLASAWMIGTSIGIANSFLSGRVTATSAQGSVNFVVTTVLTRLPNGGIAAPPLAETLKPPFENRNLSGAAGTTLPGAIVIRVIAQSWIQAGQAVPDVGVRLVNALDLSQPIPAWCNKPDKTVLTDAAGTASCDVVLGGTTGTWQIAAAVGEMLVTPSIQLEITPPVCNYTLTPASQSFGSAGGSGTVAVSAGSGCPWIAASTAIWLTISSGATGAGNGTVGYAVAANPSATRSASLVIGGQTFSVTQGPSDGGGGGGGGPAALAFVTSAFPNATMGVAYSQIVTTSGGCVTPFTGPPQVSIASGSSLPPGMQLSLNVIGGTPTTAGSYTFSLQATDSCAVKVTRSFTILVYTAAGAPPPAMTASPSAITFTVPRGSTTRPADQSLALAIAIAVSFTAASVTASGGAWLSVTPTTGMAPATLAVSVSSHAGLNAGTYNGTITVTSTAGNSPLSVPVTLVVSPPPELAVAPRSISFTFQQGVPPPGPQLISVTSTGAALGYTTTAATSSGGNWLFASPAQAATPESVAVSVNPLSLAAGSYYGTVTIARIDGAPGPVTIAVALTIQQPPPSIQAVTNGASFQPGAIAPGELVTVFGFNLGPATLAGMKVSPAGRLESTVGEARMLFDEVAAPLVYASAGQIAGFVPYAMTGRARARVQVEYRGVRSNPVEMVVTEAAPGLFTIGASGQGAILNQDGTVNSAGNAAEAGSIISLFATGEGQTDPPGQDGRLAVDALPRPRLQVAVEIGGRAAELLYAGAAPGLPAGVMQVNARIPAGAARGATPVVVKVGGYSSQSGVTVAVR